MVQNLEGLLPKGKIARKAIDISYKTPVVLRLRAGYCDGSCEGVGSDYGGGCDRSGGCNSE